MRKLILLVLSVLAPIVALADDNSLLDIARVTSTNHEVSDRLVEASYAMVTGLKVIGNQPIDENTKSVIAQIKNLSDGDLVSYTKQQVEGCEKLPKGFLVGKKRNECFFTAALLTTEMKDRGRAELCVRIDKEQLTGDHASDIAVIKAQAKCDFGD